MGKYWIKFLWVILAGVLIFAAFNRHSRSKIYTYNSQLMSDKAGYYVYLPAFFIYKFNVNKFPAKIDSLTGNGFYLNHSANKVQSKYPVGTALLECPFFLIANSFVYLVGEEPDGFNKTYQNFIDICAVFYLLLGLLFLSKLLTKYYPKTIVTVSIILISLGTNLFYYTIFEGGYSHVYSFSLFSVFLYLFDIERNKPNRYNWFGLVAICSLIILVRQMNILFILIAFISFDTQFKLVKGKKIIDWVVAIFICLVVLSPQIIYNFYLTKGPYFYSYQNEHFIYLFAPKIKEVLFGYKNGWITTNLIHVFTVLGTVLLYKKNKQISIGIMSMLIVCTYLYASWWSYELGCAYGHRGFIDIYPMLTIGLAEFCLIVDKINKKPIRNIIFILVILCVILNIKYIYTYDSCWPVSTTRSDFNLYLNFLTSPTK